jgi:RND family efflux transporter MFP subunit
MRFLLPIIIICLAGAGFWYIKDNAPQARKKPITQATGVKVETKKVAPKTLQLELQSYGQISAKTTTKLSAQVNGVVVKVADNFAEGAFFAEGDLLISLDNRDFQNTINAAKADLTQAQQDLALENAKVAQAKADWQRLNKNTKVPTLVSRTPQAKSAKAKVSSMHAKYNQAIIDFQRTKIIAPFDGRIMSKQINIGDYASANTSLAEIISTDVLQVRLPLKNSDLAFIDLPQQQLSVQQDQKTNQPNVKFTTSLIETQSWLGKIVRTEATIDTSSQQLFVIGEIEAPFSAQQNNKHSLKIGQYVAANIQGKTLPNTISINVSNLYQGEYVFIVVKGIIEKRLVTVSWRNDSIAIIADGLKAGDILVTSILSDAAQGSPADIVNGPAKSKKKGREKGDDTKNAKQKNSDKKQTN